MRGRERGGERGERRVREERTVRNVDGGGKMKIWSEEEEWRRIYVEEGRVTNFNFILRYGYYCTPFFSKPQLSAESSSVHIHRQHTQSLPLFR